MSCISPMILARLVTRSACFLAACSSAVREGEMGVGGGRGGEGEGGGGDEERGEGGCVGWGW